MGELGQAGFVPGIPVAVQAHDRRCGAAVGVRCGQIRPGGVDVEGYEHRPVGRDALVHLDDRRVHDVGQDDVECEEVGSGLGADAQCIAESARDDECGGLAPPFEQRVGGHGRAHLDRGDRAERQRLGLGHAEDLADGDDGGIGAPVWVLREDLAALRRCDRGRWPPRR